jgi:hypothetical protein
MTNRARLLFGFGRMVNTEPWTASRALLEARAVEISEDLVVDGCDTITLIGGHTLGFTTIVGQTTVGGTVVVTCAAFVGEGISVR